MKKQLMMTLLVAGFSVGLMGCPDKAKTGEEPVDGAPAVEAPKATSEAPAEVKAEVDKEITADNAEAKADELAKELEAELAAEE